MNIGQSYKISGEPVESISATHNYYGSPIAFFLKGELMINASQMAKPFGKLPADFIRLQSTADYTQALCNRYGISHNDLMKIVQGGTNQGTWMHQKLALRFSQWLSPEFAVWVDEKIEELLTTGKTELRTNQAKIPQSYSEALRLAADQAERLEKQQKEIEAAKPKVEAFEELMNCTNAISMKDLAGVLAIPGMGQTNLFKYLREKRVLNLLNKPYQEYINRRWFQLKESGWTHPRTGEKMVSTSPVVMQTGVDGIRKMLKKDRFLNKS